MRILTDWLKEFTEIPEDINQLANRLTDIGLEVDGIIEPAADIAEVRVVRLTAIDPHPKREDLKVCKIDDGNHTARVVTAAPGVNKQNHYIWAAPGSLLKGHKIESKKFAGIESEGMLCSSRELGLTENAHTLLAVPDSIVPGTSVTDALDLKHPILEIDLTPNRSDCLSHLGIARDFAAAENQDCRDPRPEQLDFDGETEAEIIIEDAEACWAYSGAAIKSVRIEQSDFEIQKRLLKMGLRPLNNIVDLTNYALFEVGHPLHPFDADRLNYPLKIRRANKGEQLTTLDGENRKLTANDLLIADKTIPHALAGIMGGAAAQVSESTKNILLEGAYFSPVTVRRSANKHKLHTEASHRFERGTDSRQYERCLLRCLQLIKQHQPQAKILKPKTVRKKTKIQEKITYRATDFEKLIGYNPGKDTIRDNFKRLGLKIEKKDSSWQVTPPSWRTDLERKEDLTEEIVRLHGYEQIPVSYPELNIKRTAIPRKDSYDKISQFMAARGFCENITFSFVSETQQNFYEDVEPYELSNPLSKRQAVMRQSLLDGLLSSYEHNSRAGEKDIRIFELGRIYPGDSSDEPRCLGLICSGKLYGENWDDKNRDFDFYDLKGLVVNLLRRLGYSQINFQPGKSPGFTGECCAHIHVDGQLVGTAGEIDSTLPEDFVEQALLSCQINIDRLPETGDTNYTPYSNQPTVLRDLDLVVDINQAVGPLRETIREAARWLENITIFDIYQGKPLPEDKKSVSFNLVFRHPGRTLSDREVGETQEKIINALRKQHNARLREA